MSSAHCKHDVVSSGLGTAVIGLQGEQQQTQDTALRRDSAQGDDIGDVIAHPHRLGSVCGEISQLHRGVLKPREASLLTRLCGMMVLNAELEQHPGTTSSHLSASLSGVLSSGGVQRKWHPL